MGTACTVTGNTLRGRGPVDEAELRLCRSIDMTGRKGRPRVRLQLEEADAELLSLAESLCAVPTLC